MSARGRAAAARAVGGTAPVGGTVTRAVEGTAATAHAPPPRIASASPADVLKGAVLRRGYHAPGVTWRDPSPFT